MNKNIIVTGGAQGIGKIISQDLLENGYSVSVFEIDKEAIEEFKTETNAENIAFFSTDVANEKCVCQSVLDSAKRFGNISGLINNAAIHANKSITELSFEDWNRVLSVNLSGTFLCTKYATPYLKNAKGSIINMCSTRAFQSEPNTEAYSASKGGIYSLTHSLAMSLGPDISVNSISPGWIDVSGIRKTSAVKTYQQTEEDKAQHPAGRVGTAKDISNMILFLLNPANSFITAQNFIIDGGMTRKMIYV